MSFRLDIESPPAILNTGLSLLTSVFPGQESSGNYSIRRPMKTSELNCSTRPLALLSALLPLLLGGCDDPYRNSAARPHVSYPVAKDDAPAQEVATPVSSAPHSAGASDFSAGEAKSDVVQGQENAVLTDAPNVPPPITRTHDQGPL